VDARTHDGRTPLMICAENCFLHGAQMLLEGGANAGLECWEHQYSALHLAALAADPRLCPSPPPFLLCTCAHRSHARFTRTHMLANMHMQHTQME